MRTAVINKRAGGIGLISGRKAFQRPMNEGIELLNAIQDVYLDRRGHDRVGRRRPAGERRRLRHSSSLAFSPVVIPPAMRDAEVRGTLRGLAKDPPSEGRSVTRRYDWLHAGVAQLVEHQLPKLRVASSSLVSRFIPKVHRIDTHAGRRKA